MGQLEAIQQQILELTPLEIEAPDAWLNQCKQDAWDRQMASDLEAGDLDALVSEALEDYRADRVFKR